MHTRHYKKKETHKKKRNIKKGAANPKESPSLRQTTAPAFFLFSLRESTNTNTSQHPLSVDISATNTKKREISSIFLSR